MIHPKSVAAKARRNEPPAVCCSGDRNLYPAFQFRDGDMRPSRAACGRSSPSCHSRGRGLSFFLTPDPGLDDRSPIEAFETEPRRQPCRSPPQRMSKARREFIPTCRPGAPAGINRCRVPVVRRVARSRYVRIHRAADGPVWFGRDSVTGMFRPPIRARHSCSRVSKLVAMRAYSDNPRCPDGADSLTAVQVDKTKVTRENKCGDRELSQLRVRPETAWLAADRLGERAVARQERHSNVWQVSL